MWSPAASIRFIAVKCLVFDFIGLDSVRFVDVLHQLLEVGEIRPIPDRNPRTAEEHHRTLIDLIHEVDWDPRALGYEFRQADPCLLFSHRARSAESCSRFQVDATHRSSPVALRMGGANEAVLDYYLLPLPVLDMKRIRLAEDNGLTLDGFRFDTLDFFFAMAERARISEVAP